MDNIINTEIKCKGNLGGLIKWKFNFKVNFALLICWGTIPVEMFGIHPRYTKKYGKGNKFQMYLHKNRKIRNQLTQFNAKCSDPHNARERLKQFLTKGSYSPRWESNPLDSYSAVKAGITFSSVDETVACDHSDESYGAVCVSVLVFWVFWVFCSRIVSFFCFNFELNHSIFRVTGFIRCQMTITTTGTGTKHTNLIYKLQLKCFELLSLALSAKGQLKVLPSRK